MEDTFHLFIAIAISLFHTSSDKEELKIKAYMK